MRPEEQIRRFEELLTAEAYNSAWRYCCLLAPQREDAEDLLQDALLLAIRRIAQLRDPGSLRGWLLSIVRSTFLNTRRRSSREALRLQQFGEFMLRSESDARSGPLIEELSALPQSERLLLTLFYIEGLSLRETAQALGLSEPAAQSRLHRARELLRRRVESAVREGGQTSEGCHV